MRWILEMLKSPAQPSRAPAHWAIVARLIIVFATGLSAYKGYGQTLIPELKSAGEMKLRQTDFAVLERKEPRTDLPCTVSRIKPELDWDFTFHTGYQVGVPLTELAGSGNELIVLFRVVPLSRADEPVYMMQRTPIPPIEAGAKGEGRFHGYFTLGEGKYHVDWLMRNQQGHICSTSWDLETKVNSKETQLRPWISQAPILPPSPPFADEPPVVRTPEIRLPRVSIIVNFDPADPSSARLDERDIETLMATLRRIRRDPRIETYSFIACSLEIQQVVYQQEDISTIHLPALGEALRSLKFGIVDAKRLTLNKGATQFATDLIREHLTKEKPDALVVLGRKAGWESRVSREALESFEKLGIPAYYFSYNADQQLGLTRDPISSIVKRLGGLEYAINRPKDFFDAWSNVVDRILRAKQAESSVTVQAAAN